MQVPERLDLAQFIAPSPPGGGLVEGLTDNDDIKVLCHLMLGKLAASAHAQPMLVELVERGALLDALRKTICATTKENAVKQQVERHEELVRSGMRAARALEKMADAEASPKLLAFGRDVLRGPKLLEKYEAVCREDDAKKADGED